MGRMLGKRLGIVDPGKNILRHTPAMFFGFFSWFGPHRDSFSRRRYMAPLSVGNGNGKIQPSARGTFQLCRKQRPMTLSIERDEPYVYDFNKKQKEKQKQKHSPRVQTCRHYCGGMKSLISQTRPHLQFILPKKVVVLSVPHKACPITLPNLSLLSYTFIPRKKDPTLPSFFSLFSFLASLVWNSRAGREVFAV